MIGAAVQQANSLYRALGAVGSDIAGAVRGSDRIDPLDMRDPDYIAQTLPGQKAISRLYHRAEVRGLENIPEEGPVLLVGNHSGGTLIVDTFAFSVAFYDHFGPERQFHQLAHDLVFQVPGIRALLTRWGTVPANPENMARALEKDAALLVYPGGDHETYRPTWEQDKIGFDGRKGFVKLALKHNVPVVPVVAIGGQETALFLGRGRRIANALKLPERARLKVLPPQLGPPLGLTVLDLPLRFPLPAKITVTVGKPIDLRGRLGRNPDPGDGYDLVTSTMQRTLTRLGHERTVPVFG